ncbi:MAG: hypothetical protein KF773_24325, partial [Deltaproteobacteria bacterium]|nr:hypothetical protein [Deltaproteobacteria bacterium]
MTPVFEHPCLAPEDLLRWMIQNPSRLDWSTLEESGLASSTLQKRRALRGGSEPVMHEALELLATRRRPGPGQWHVLEGVTKVDCALLGEDLTVFIEGKRTEPRLTERASWLNGRDQVIRNLDCLRVEPRRAAHWLSLMVVDAGSTAEADARRLDLGGARLAAAVPHLSTEAANDLWSHYAGYTTWQAIE